MLDILKSLPILEHGSTTQKHQCLDTSLERLPRSLSLNSSAIRRVSPDIVRQALLLTAHSSFNETREGFRFYEGVRGLANGSKRLRTTHFI